VLEGCSNPLKTRKDLGCAFESFVDEAIIGVGFAFLDDVIRRSNEQISWLKVLLETKLQYKP